LTIMGEDFKKKIEDEEDSGLPSRIEDRNKVRKDDISGGAVLTSRATLPESQMATEEQLVEGRKRGLNLTGISRREAAKALVNYAFNSESMEAVERLEIIKNKGIKLGDAVTLENKDTQYTVMAITDSGRIMLKGKAGRFSPRRLTKV